MQKFLENLEEAETIIKTADHLTYVTFPVVRDQKLLLKIILELKKGIANCINSILQYEYICKKISLSKNPETNFKTFVEKSSKHYKITGDEIKKILELFDIVKKHQTSSMEVAKESKFIMLSENMQPTEINLEKTKEFTALAKSILKKTEDAILAKI